MDNVLEDNDLRGSRQFARPEEKPSNFDTMVLLGRQDGTFMSVMLLIVVFSRALDDAKAPVIQQEALFWQQEPVNFQQEPVIFQEEAPVDRPKLGFLGVESVESAESAGLFS